jgi:hypothetical protein
MGVYYHLSCRHCGRYVHFGKKLRQDNRDMLQGMYSEKTHEWIDDERIWRAPQSFLLEHKGHSLIFDSDDDDNTIDDYIESELDTLLKREHKNKVR